MLLNPPFTELYNPGALLEKPPFTEAYEPEAVLL
jgi:hypothetical protein